MIPPSSLRLFRNLAFAGLLLILNANVRAADGIWNGSVSTSWDNADNWTDGLPGAAATSEPGANADTATFNLSSSVASARRSVVVPTVSGGAWSLKSIAFSGPTGIIYTIGANAGPALWLTSGGSISYLPSVGSTTTQIIAAPLVLQPTGATEEGAYTFTNSVTSTAYLNFTGAVSGGATTQGITLTLGGSALGSTATNTNRITGLISDGDAEGGLSIVKNGAGTWYLGNSGNTFSGGVTLNDGLLNVQTTPKALGTGTLTLNGGTLSAATTANTNEITNASVWNGDFTLIGSANIQFSGTVSLGDAPGAIRGVTVASGNARFSGAISDGASGKGFRKDGAGVLNLSNTANTFTGGVTIHEGTLIAGTLGLTGGASSLGTHGFITFDGDSGTLSWSTGGTTDKTIQLAGGAGSTATLTANIGNTPFSFTGDLSGTTGGAKTLILTTGNGQSNFTYAGKISDGVEGSVLSVIRDGGTGGGVWTLSNLENDFTGGVTITASSITSTLNVTKIGNAGEASPLGTHGIITLEGGASAATLRYTGTTDETTDKVIQISGGAGTTSSLYQSGVGKITYGGSISGVTEGGKILSLQASNGTTAEISGLISDGVAGSSLAIAKIGGNLGVWTLSNPDNSFTGGVTIDGGGGISVAQIGNAGELSPLGTHGTITFGTSTLAQQLIYTGTGETTDKALLLTGGTGSIGQITQSGSGKLIFTGGASIATEDAPAALRLAGAGEMEFTGGISDGAQGAQLAVQKYNSGTITFSGANTFTGGLVLNGGTVNVNHAQALGAGTVTFATNGGVSLANTSGAPITVTGVNYVVDAGMTGNFIFTGSNDLDLGSGTFTLERDKQIAVTDSASLTLSGGILGDFLLQKTGSGAGALILAGDNAAFTGGVALSAGTLALDHANALGSGTFTITGGTLANARGSALHLATHNAQVWNGNFTFAGPDDLDLGTGAVSLGTVTGTTRTLTVDAGALAVGGVISNGTTAVNLTKAGAGALTLGGANTLTGNLTLSDGTLNLNNAGALGAGIFVIANNANTKIIDNTTGATLRLGNDNAQTWNTGFVFQGTNDLNLGGGSISLDGVSAGTRTVTVAQNNLTIEGIISGSSNRHIQKDGAGTLIFAQDEFAPNTYAGQTRISEGVLRLAGYGALPGGIGSTGGTNSLILDGGVIEMTADSGDFERGIGTGVTQVQITANGGGFSAYDTDIAVNLGGSQGTVIWGGTGFADTAKLMLSSSVAQATVDFQNAINLQNSEGDSVREVQVANGSAAIDAKISGVLSDDAGTGGLNKTGEGTLQLTAVNTYRGQTIITAGTLIVDGSIAESSGITIEEGAFLSGHGTVSQLSGSGTISPGNSPGILTAGSVDGSGGLDFTFEFTLAPVDGVSLPDFGNASDSGNDVLRLTDGTPFVFALNGGNQITVDFGLGTNPGLGDVFIGGFYSDSANFFASISGAQFVYLGLDEGLSVVVSTIQQTANFGSGDVNGYVTQFAVIPEPRPMLMMLVGGLLGCLMIFRRKGGGTFLSPNCRTNGSWKAPAPLKAA